MQPNGMPASDEDSQREADRALAEQNDDLAAIQAGIEDMEAGRATPLAEVDAAIRAKLGFSARR